MVVALAELGEPRFVLAFDDDPRGVATDAYHARGRTSVFVHEDHRIVSLVRCSIVVPDAAARATLCDALAGPGGVAGIAEAHADAEHVAFTFDDERTSLELVFALVDVELAPYGRPRRMTFHDPLSDAALARVAAWGLGDPAITDERTIEHAVAKVRA
jgi:hypothetical protein